MNVDGDESRRRLNYYSRSSPKKRRSHLTDQYRSPLMPQPHFKTSRPISIHHGPPHRTPLSKSKHSSFRNDVLQISRSSNSPKILIEDSGEEEILIQDSPTEEQRENVETVTSFPEKEEIIQLEKQGHRIPRRSSGNDIRIEDDQILQVVKEDKKEADPQENSKNQNQQSMSRQFTFGQQLAQAQKAEIQILPQMIKEVQESEPSSPRPTQQQGHSQQAILSESDKEKHSEKTPRRPQLDMSLIMTSQEVQDYQSPKFNALPLKPFEDKWITAQDNHFLSSPKGNQILIEEQPPSGKSSARTSLSLRPFGRSIALLGEVVELVPVELGQVYSKMHRKLVGDQINAEERQQQQQTEKRTLRLLLQLRRQGIGCEQYLLKSFSQPDGQIELNRLIIHALIRRIAGQK